MKKLFTAIRKGDIDTVKALIEKDNSLVFCVAKQPPKSDDGQSPLQVALKTGRLEIADYLLDMGADVNFTEDVSCVNMWRTPVVFDAINCAIMNCRFNVVRESEIEVFSTKENADKAFMILERMIKMGADINAVSSIGNNSLFRACLQAAQILPRYDYSTKTLWNDRKITIELKQDLSRIFNLLINSGVDMSFKNQAGKTVFEFFENQPVLNFVK
ncbi:MAG: ankyrin repeat domain-containing protein [Clostridia bacterium]|nr:ankyrin repeat domain-containing protein [Clostridia bacterium]